MSARRNLGRIHIWLGWLIGIPLLIWTATGLWMVARPIDEVRGVQLKAEPPVLATNATPVFPKLPSDHGAPLSIKLEQQWDGPVWIAAFAHGHEMRASASDGRWLPPITEEQARAIARQWYRPNTEIMSATHSPADAPPIDLRKEKAAWQIAFADGANVYVDADTGSLLAIRSGQWRIFDFMWGLHIMDLQTRENTSHPILILFAIMAFIGTAFGLILLPLSARRKRRRQ
ncbi:PepSY domain-containing protein [Sphingorhabdus sp.]|uniref:PepSY domain-containing protein n=1 Tax=Sphingorhabdus sp. TaxID=1902408 RepID=UPI0032B715F8